VASTARADDAVVSCAAAAAPAAPVWLLPCRYGPQPIELGGQRALDFVLDNPTLQVSYVQF
jgi:hypothetical protein